MTDRWQLEPSNLRNDDPFFVPKWQVYVPYCHRIQVGNALRAKWSMPCDIPAAITPVLRTVTPSG